MHRVTRHHSLTIIQHLITIIPSLMWFSLTMAIITVIIPPMATITREAIITMEDTIIVMVAAGADTINFQILEFV